MDDNARPHRARLVNGHLQSENIRRMDWPARSPDLNPIEHVWDALGRRIGARHPSPRTLVELRTALLEEWGLLPLDLLQSLVKSMRARYSPQKGSIDRAPIIQTAQNPTTASRSDVCPLDWTSLRRCSGHNADIALKLALHALPHPDHPASTSSSYQACGSVDRSLDHRYWSCRRIRPLIIEAFSVLGRPPDLRAWIFGSGLEDDDLAILASAKSIIYRYFLQTTENHHSGGSPFLWQYLSALPLVGGHKRLTRRVATVVLTRYGEVSRYGNSEMWLTNGAMIPPFHGATQVMDCPVVRCREPLRSSSNVHYLGCIKLLLYVYVNFLQGCGHENMWRMPGHRKRRQFKQTDAFTRGMVIGLKRAGWSIRQIAADTHLGASTVHRLWRRWLEQGNVAIYRNVGATRVTSARVDRRILRQAVAAPQATCTAILQHVQDTLDHSISTRTISRRLVANGLHSCRPLRRLPLTPPNRRQRLEWCRARSTWMTEWHRVVFSDESRFCLSSDSRRVRVWRRRGERSNPAAIVERPTVRQRGIMVWGAIAYDSRSPLLRIQGTMTAQRYVDDVLRPVTLPYLQGVPNALYQQDNARPHTARISHQALQDVQMLPWPPYSPDLSPIEHVWDIIGRRLHALPQPRSEDELWQMVEREWRAIPQDAIRTLIDSLPRRVAACIAVRGGPTCY
ncbi:Transposase [Cordylochernes scorpioides]|uniref:Transposase n=1 Tax=Cordylochernes scorpioides TaxID=51811 RepID=A0ABY6KXY3_9ARAC|nr:Transposase [Cordylochernes scorpioides]